MKPKDLSLAKVQALSQLALPEHWKCVRAEIKFEREGHLGEWATVVYDGHNNTFYVQTNKAIVYQNDTPALEEAIALMREANTIINSPRTEDSPH
jgi:hypothetical protein